MSIYKLTKQKENLVKQDIEKYLMGQLRIKDIANNREVPPSIVMRIEREIIYSKMGI